jgi:tricorn protease-like protein
MTRTRTARRGIVIERHPYDRGYWRRYDGGARKSCRSPQERQGWRDCDAELRFERQCLRDAAS